LGTLLPLSKRIDAILAPSNPTPKTELLVSPIFDEAMGGFAAMRGDWMRRSLSGMVSRIEEIDEGGIWEGGRGGEKVRALVDLCELLIIIMEVGEH
jgi:exocyst complex protein 7